METFVVRLFVPVDESASALTGVAEHVGTDWSTRFTCGDELLDALSTWLGRSEPDADRRDRRLEARSE